MGMWIQSSDNQAYAIKYTGGSGGSWDTNSRQRLDDSVNLGIIHANGVSNLSNYKMISMCASGTAIAVFSERFNDGGSDTSRVYARNYDGTGWLDAVQLHTDITVSMAFPSVEVNSTGTGVVLFWTTNKVLSNIFSQF